MECEGKISLMEVLDENRSHQLIKINAEFVEALERHIIKKRKRLYYFIFPQKNFFQLFYDDVILTPLCSFILHLQNAHIRATQRRRILSFVWLLASAILLSAGLSALWNFSSFIHANTKGILWSVNKASGCEDVEQATTKAHHNIISAWCIINNLSFAIISHFLLQIHIVSLSICARSRFYRRLLCIFIQLSSRAPKVWTSFSMSSVVLS